MAPSFVGEPDKGLTRYAHATSHQPGAYHAPIAFLAGDLFTREFRDSLYPLINVPTLVVHDKDGYTRFHALASFIERHPHWSAERIAPTKGMPQFEQPAQLANTLDAFWRKGVHGRG